MVRTRLPEAHGRPATGLTPWAVGRGRRGRNHLRNPALRPHDRFHGVIDWSLPVPATGNSCRCPQSLRVQAGAELGAAPGCGEPGLATVSSGWGHRPLSLTVKAPEGWTLSQQSVAAARPGVCGLHVDLGRPVAAAADQLKGS